MTYSIQQTDIDMWLNTLQGKVTSILQGSQLSENLLGTLEFSPNTSITIPAVYRRSKDLPKDQWRMVPGSGIECIIHDSIEFSTEPMIGNNATWLRFCIELVQHNTGSTNLQAILRLTNNSYLEVLNSPQTSPYAQLSEGEVFERTIIKAVVHQWMKLEKLV